MRKDTNLNRLRLPAGACRRPREPDTLGGGELFSGYVCTYIVFSTAVLFLRNPQDLPCLSAKFCCPPPQSDAPGPLQHGLGHRVGTNGCAHASYSLRECGCPVMFCSVLFFAVRLVFERCPRLLVEYRTSDADTCCLAEQVNRPWPRALLVDPRGIKDAPGNCPKDR